MNRYNRFIGCGIRAVRLRDGRTPRPRNPTSFFHFSMNNDFKGGGSKWWVRAKNFCYHHPFEMFFAFKIRGTARKTDISYPHPPSCHRIKGKYGRKII